MNQLFTLILLIFCFSSSSLALCSKGYKTKETAEAAVAAYFGEDDLSWCEDLPLKEHVLADDVIAVNCIVDEESKKAVKFKVFKVKAGLCARNIKDYYVAVRGPGFTYEHYTDLDPN